MLKRGTSTYTFKTSCMSCLQGRLWELELYWHATGQSSKQFLKRKLLQNKAALRHNSDIYKNPPIAFGSSNVKYLRLRWKKIDCLASQVGGSKNIFCDLFGDENAENTFWLDSSCTDQVTSSFAKISTFILIYQMTTLTCKFVVAILHGSSFPKHANLYRWCFFYVLIALEKFLCMFNCQM